MLRDFRLHSSVKDYRSIRPVLNYCLWTTGIGFYTTGCLILLCLPNILLWILLRYKAPSYILLTVSLVWSWVVLLGFEVTSHYVYFEISVSGEFGGICIRIFAYFLIFVFTTAYPVLMVYIGNIRSTKDWTQGKRVAVSVSCAIFASVAALGFFRLVCCVEIGDMIDNILVSSPPTGV